jgi:integrase
MSETTPAGQPTAGSPGIPADLVQLRREALRMYSLQFAHPPTRTTMTSALRRLARTFSAGECDEQSFPWELLCDVADVLAIRNSAMAVYQRATVSRDQTALRTMLRCCWRVGLLDYDEYKRAIDLPRLPRVEGAPAGRLLSPAELGLLLTDCRQDPNPTKGLRDAAAIITAASSGVRRAELVAIPTTGLALADRLIDLSGTLTKGGQPRLAYLRTTAAVVLGEWFDLRGAHAYLFPPVSRSGRVLADRHLSSHQFWTMLRARGIAAALPAPVTAHDLRRYTVSHLLDTQDLVMVSRVVGHRSPVTTERYDRRSRERCRDAIDTLPLPRWTQLHDGVA